MARSTKAAAKVSDPWGVLSRVGELLHEAGVSGHGTTDVEGRLAEMRNRGFASGSLVQIRSRNPSGPHGVQVNGLTVTSSARHLLLLLLFAELARRRNGVFFPSRHLVVALEALKALAMAQGMAECLPNLVVDDLHKLLSAFRQELKRGGAPVNLIERSALGYRLQGLPGDIGIDVPWIQQQPGYEEVFRRCLIAVTGADNAKTVTEGC